MTTLRELVVTSGSNASPHDQYNPEALGILLTTLQSPLQELWIADYQQEQISLGFLHDHLFRFAPTLDFLNLVDLSSDIFLFPVTTPFMAMRSLRVSSVRHFSFFRLDILLRLFPKLDDTLFLKGFNLPVDEYLPSREQNQEAQKEYTWPGFYCVTCSVALAFTMALRCPIRSMHVYGPVLEEARYLTEVLRDNCPQQLLLPIKLSGHDHLQILDGLFPPEAGDRLTHLVLFFETSVNRRRRPSGEWDNFSWDQFMDIFVHATKHLRHLTHLRVVLYYYIHTPASESASKSAPDRPNASAPPEPPDSDEAFAHNIAHDADLYPTAIRLLSTFPALEYVLLTTCGMRRFGWPWKCWYSSRVWRVQDVVSDSKDPRRASDPLDEALARGSRSRTCVELSEEAEEGVIDKEELYFDQREEAAFCVICRPWVRGLIDLNK
ncbi:hypothetical protein GSI_05827 [Ganoderma sinense ZZ0214-1]|uniref:F-box domain-containing protein n=1 Tax=Ganoderma sinense ZZ0214-1 TaxID=1077348 RepID=A0A2G8SBK7_9APHY|nr:hypothetical protein GSI_05827 [Ganoderma sinense ZZ0214-1]